MPQVEAAGYAGLLAETVVRRAFGEWRGDALQKLGLGLAVNLPLDVLMLPGEAELLEAAREQAGIDPGRLTVELTETHPVLRPELLRPVLERLRTVGYQLSIDDVGPGTIDVASLLALPFTVLKLDRDVVRGSESDPAAAGFIATTIAGARQAGMKVSAEGIETVEDWARMERLGVDAAQGFLVGRPLTAVATAIWHEAWLARKAT